MANSENLKTPMNPNVAVEDDLKLFVKRDLKPSVTEFNWSRLKMIVKQRNGSENIEVELEGRISFLSRSNCMDCSTVRSFFRERGLKFVGINIDVYPTRETGLVERTESSSVPQIFFNKKSFGGLVVLNLMRNNGLLEQKLKELLGRKCPDDGPALPAYGFDDPDDEDERADEMVQIVRHFEAKRPKHPINTVGAVS